MFKRYAQKVIADIQQMGKLPILVGGTGLYIDSVLFDFGFVDAADPRERDKLEKLSIEELQQIIEQNGYPMPQNRHNRRHLIRTIERKGEVGTKKDLRREVILIGLAPPDEVIRNKIKERVENYFNQGLLE